MPYPAEVYRDRGRKARAAGRRRPVIQRDISPQARWCHEAFRAGWDDEDSRIRRAEQLSTKEKT